MCRVLLAMVCALSAAAQPPKSNPVWQNAEVISVNTTTTHSEELSMSAADGSFPPSSVIARRTTTCVYVLKIDGKVVTAKLTGKPLSDVKEGTTVRVRTKNAQTLQILAPAAKHARTAEVLPQ